MNGRDGSPHMCKHILDDIVTWVMSLGLWLLSVFGAGLRGLKNQVQHEELLLVLAGHPRRPKGVQQEKAVDSDPVGHHQETNAL